MSPTSMSMVLLSPLWLSSSSSSKLIEKINEKWNLESVEKGSSELLAVHHYGKHPPVALCQ